MLTILIFIIVLGVLVFVHELGHFLVAKKAGVFVEEFGFGYRPRALKLGKKWGTLFTLNWIPFGGFVKILGEDYEEVGEGAAVRKQQKTFTQVSKKWQAAILAAGVTFNILFAWLLFSLSFMGGVPASAENAYGVPVKNPSLTIVDVLSSSPAQAAGLKAGDKITEVSLANGQKLGELTSENVSNFINSSQGEVNIQVDRGGKVLNFNIVPKTGIIEGRKLIGIDMDTVGTVTLPIHKAFYQGAKATGELTYGTITSIGGLIRDAFRGKADVSNIAGPVGIVGLVGDASRLGFVYLVTFTALISINLAIINLVPFPALDGGRILFVIIEGITKRKINPKFVNITNTVGFALLIMLMLFVTYRDILRLF